MTPFQSVERRLDELVAHGLNSSAERSKNDALAAQVLQTLASRSLPAQRHSGLSAWWPAALLDIDLMPAWPRVAVLACAGIFGVAIGLFGADVSAFEQRAPGPAAAAAGETSLVALVFDPEPVTGVRP